MWWVGLPEVKNNCPTLPIVPTWKHYLFFFFSDDNDDDDAVAAVRSAAPLSAAPPSAPPPSQHKSCSSCTSSTACERAVLELELLKAQVEAAKAQANAYNKQASAFETWEKKMKWVYYVGWKIKHPFSISVGCRYMNLKTPWSILLKIICI